MCGIIGYKLFKNSEKAYREYFSEAIGTLVYRGPDSNGIYQSGSAGLGHTRLSIMDTSDKANQPMSDPTGRYTLIFNGEIYNYQELKNFLPSIEFRSSSDTEVLLHLLIKEGTSCLEKLNGFFAFAFYDKEDDKLLLARDRMGIKPLHYYQDENKFVFGSEMKALLCFDIPRKIDHHALYWYLKLNYLPGSLSMLEGVKKLEPGHYLEIKRSTVQKSTFFEFDDANEAKVNYDDAKSELVNKLEQSVKSRLMADVPLGSFLSGGTDSSAIVALASRHHSNLNTFSIGYADHPFFDETYYAELVAKKFNTTHTTFKLTNDDLLDVLSDIIEYIDEPFADSSAIPTYILSKNVAKHVKVALSGDGADELFGGYYKHLALSQSLKPSLTNFLLKNINPLISHLPQSRSGTFSNLIRRLGRYGKMMKANPSERYWLLASLTNDPSSFLLSKVDSDKISTLKRQFLRENSDLNEYLDADIKMLLPGDMLTKVDLMSMANSLEVRVPFLDKNVVEFARSLPGDFKVNGSQRKRIVQDAFKTILPKELYNRSKKGFEVPLLQWMRRELLADLDLTLFNKVYLESQAIFISEEVLNLRQKLLSNNPEDVHGIIWALYVFQKWYMRYMD